ncbi:unnamed protein product [Rotaria magnacalcarata]|uniref:Uncharacterized protein n=1 Tax=Rotaria magnacalcarata TaxID=392030 RepID=A0A820JGN6_9BILA|nr:unnamed protein product [Rotaria magnacalcarata]
MHQKKFRKLPSSDSARKSESTDVTLTSQVTGGGGFLNQVEDAIGGMSGRTGNPDQQGFSGGILNEFEKMAGGGGGEMMSEVEKIATDVIQICFNGEKVLSTWTVIRALNTGTFICYNLTNDVNSDYYSSTQEQFGNNHDYLQLQQNFVQMGD